MRAEAQKAQTQAQLALFMLSTGWFLGVEAKTRSPGFISPVLANMYSERLGIYTQPGDGAQKYLFVTLNMMMNVCVRETERER